MNNRKEKLEHENEETENEIKNIHLVVQGLKDLKDTALRLDEKTKISLLMDSCEKEISFLETLIDSNKETLVKDGLV